MTRSTLYPASVQPGKPRLGNKPSGWNRLKFGNILEPIYRPIQLDDKAHYQLVNAKRNRGGIVPRDILKGKDVKTETQFQIAHNDFLISKRQIIHGACGIVPAELDGAIVSNEYVCLRPNSDLLIDYLGIYSHTIYFQQTCYHSSVGVDIEKMIFRLDEWLKYDLYLPPLPEQRKIAAILGTWDEAIDLTRRLIEALKQRKQALMQMLLTGEVRFPGFDEDWEEVSIEDIAAINPSRKTNLADEMLVSFVGMTDVSEDAKLVTRVTRLLGEVKKGFTAFADDDVLVAKITPCFENGKGALVENLENGLGFGSTEFHVIRANKARVLPEIIYSHTISSNFRKQGESNMSGSAGQKRIPAEYIRSYTISLPNLAEQAHLIELLKGLDEEVDLLTKHHEALQTQKRGLMQKLLTGQVRVQVEGDEDGL